MGSSPWGRKESDVTERLNISQAWVSLVKRAEWALVTSGVGRLL